MPGPDRTTYTVEEGDTLSSIAVKLYGSERRWVDIAQANPLLDPQRLRIGQTLKLPTPQQIANDPLAGREDVPPPGEVVQYTIRTGDSLWNVAQQYYGDGSQWRIIYNRNRQKIGQNPADLQAGMKIEIPPSPEPAR